VKRPAGRGWPEQCPPVRAANACGWDVLNAFDLRFVRDAQGHWDVEEAVEVHSDIDLGEGMTPHPQVNAWFWERGQRRPHVIDDHVWLAIRHQVKVSTYLYLDTDPGVAVLLGPVPNRSDRRWSVVEALLETDWYRPAHPWHTVLELPRIEDDPATDVVEIAAGEPLCRIRPVPRGRYEATELGGEAFGALFAEGQQWLAAHGRDLEGDDLDITGAYARVQRELRFTVRPDDASE